MLAFYMAMLDDPQDRLSFEELYRRYRDKMMSLAYSITGNFHDAEEAVSQAFFAAARNFGRIKDRPPRERSAYISVITKNEAYDILRAKKRQGELTVDDDENAPEIADEKTDVSDEVLSRVGYDSLLEAIRSLPEKYAQTMYLFYVTGLSIRETADSLGESEANIKKRLQRAREKLRSLIENVR